MVGTKDIKDFTKYPSLSDNDYLLGTKSDLGGTDAGIKVSDLKKLVGQDVKPEIKNGYWWVNGVNTGQLAIGRTPKFRFTTLGLEMKYEDEDNTAYLVIIPIEDLLFAFDDLTPEQVELLKLKFSDLTEADKETLRGAAFTFDMFTPEQLADLRLTWEKLTPDQKNEIKGERGYSAFEVWTQQEGNAGKTVDDYLAWLRQPATEAAAEIRKGMLQISQDASAAIKAASDAAGNAQEAADNVQDGKTPVLESVNAQSGDMPSGSFSENGIDASGNPKYILNLILPAGKDGQPAIFEQGTTTTLEPAEEARVEIVENGETEQGNPKYILNFFIPRGQVGKPGEGSGNVSVDGTGLVIGKKYLFVPSSDDSTAGTFVEYVAPEIPEQVQPDWNATEGKAAILHKPGDATADTSGLMSADQFQKLEKLNPSSLSNDVTGKKVEYTDAGKLLFEGKETFAVDANNELTLAGKKLSELGGAVQYLDLSPLFDAEGSPVTTTTNDFLAQVETAYVNHIGLAIVDGYVASMSILADETTYNITASLSVVSDNYLMRLNNNAQLVVYGFIITKADKSVSSALSLNELTNTGDGTKFKSDDGTYKAIGAQYLDFSPLFDAEGNLITTTTDEFLAQIETAYVNHARVAIIDGDTLSMNILSNETTYNIIASFLFISNDLLTQLNNDIQLIVYYFKITKADKSVSLATSINELINTGDGTKFKSDDGSYKEVGGSDFVEIPFAVLELTNSSTSDQIKTAFGGDTAFDEIHQKIKSGKMAYCIFSVEESGITIAIPFIADGGVSAAETKTLQLMFINPLLQDPELASLTFIKSIADNTYTVMSVTNKLSYDLVTTVSNGLMSSADKKKLDRIGSYTTATTVANLDANYENIEISNLSANASLSVNLTGATYNGWEIFVAIYCSSARTITIPTTGSYVSMIGSSLSCPAGKWTELHLKCTGGKWRIAKLEQQ